MFFLRRPQTIVAFLHGYIRLLVIESRVYGSWVAESVAKPAGPAPMMETSQCFFRLLRTVFY